MEEKKENEGNCLSGMFRLFVVACLLVPYISFSAKWYVREFSGCKEKQGYLINFVYNHVIEEGSDINFQEWDDPCAIMMRTIEYEIHYNDDGSFIMESGLVGCIDGEECSLEN